MNESKMKEEVWTTVQELNRLWVIENKADDLVNYFHKNMVAIIPAGRLRVEGQEACVAGWKQFTQTAKIHFWKESDPKIDLYGNGSFAIVTYYFSMSFDIGGKTINMDGRDMFSLVNEEGKWWVVADQYSADPK